MKIIVEAVPSHERDILRAAALPINLLACRSGRTIYLVDVRFMAEPEKIAVLVVGGEKNAYWSATDFGYLKSESIDRWR